MSKRTVIRNGVLVGAAAGGLYWLLKQAARREPAWPAASSLAAYPARTLLNESAYGNYSETLIESTGSKIALSIYEVGNEAPCVVFLAGTMTHPLFYDQFLTVLAQNGFNVIGVHTVSHGKSPRERKLFTFQDLVQNARDAISYCIQTFNDNIVLMGSSQGGIVSMACAAADGRVKAVFPHNILLPSLTDSIQITRFPLFLKPFYHIIRRLMQMGARIVPNLPLPITFYLELDRVFAGSDLEAWIFSDPLTLSSYPLFFLASLFSADLSGMTDGRIGCPVVVITSTGDPLFPFAYCQKVFGRIVAPHKELLIFDEPYHLILNECVEMVTEPIVEKLRAYT